MTERIAARLKGAGIPMTIEVGATMRATHDSEGSPAPPVDVSWVGRLPHVSVDLDERSGDLGTGKEISDLEIVGTIGEGGMGRVVLARQHSLQRDVAIKTAKAEGDARSAAAIVAEGVVAGQLEHPAIVPVHMLGRDDHGRPVIVMKRVEGVNWNVLLQNPRHPGWEGWDGDETDRLAGHLQILRAVANALHFAHTRRVVHRDVKPENVLIGRFGDVYLADWGVAIRMDTPSARISGTAGYMAPEMTRPGSVDERTDVYLLGATLHEILTGRMRHDAPTAMAAIVLAMESERYEYAPTVPPELAALANSACHLDPLQRPKDARAFERAVATYREHRESAALASRASERLDRIEQTSLRDDLDETARRDLDRWVVEASFGVEAALAQWSENPIARRASERLEGLMLERRERQARLEQDAREVDPAIDARPRAIAMTLFALVALGLAASAFIMDVRTISSAELIAYPSVILGAALFGAYLRRRTILKTRINRQLVASVIAPLVLMVLGRAAGAVVNLPAETHFAVGCFLLASSLAVVAITLIRTAAVPAAIMTLGGCLVFWFPEHALRIFSFSTSSALLAGIVLAWRVSQRGAA